MTRLPSYKIIQVFCVRASTLETSTSGFGIKSFNLATLQVFPNFFEPLSSTYDSQTSLFRVVFLDPSASYDVVIMVWPQ